MSKEKEEVVIVEAPPWEPDRYIYVPTDEPDYYEETGEKNVPETPLPS